MENKTIHSTLSDGEFLKQLNACSLHPSYFDHEGHLRLAWLNLRSSGTGKGIELTVDQISRFVAHLGATDKFNLTLTVAAVHIVHHFFRRSEVDSFPGFLKEFPQLKTDFKSLVQQHYSPEILWSEVAKREFVSPDLAPFQGGSGC